MHGHFRVCIRPLISTIRANTIVLSVSRFSLSHSKLRSACYRHSLIPSTTHYAQKRSSIVEGLGYVDVPDDMTVSKVEERVLKAIKSWDRFPQDKLSQLTINSKFTEDLSFDSLDQVEIIMTIEDEFKFDVPDTDLDTFKTPRDIVKYVCDREDVIDYDEKNYIKC